MSYWWQNRVAGYGWWHGLSFSLFMLALRPLCRLFCGHIHAIVGLVDQGCHFLSLNDILGGN